MNVIRICRRLKHLCWFYVLTAPTIRSSYEFRKVWNLSFYSASCFLPVCACCSRTIWIDRMFHFHCKVKAKNVQYWKSGSIRGYLYKTPLFSTTVLRIIKQKRNSGLHITSLILSLVIKTITLSTGKENRWLIGVILYFLFPFVYRSDRSNPNIWLTSQALFVNFAACQSRWHGWTPNTNLYLTQNQCTFKPGWSQSTLNLILFNWSCTS